MTHKRRKIKILLIGANGQLGRDLEAAFGSDEIIPLTHNDIEITDYEHARDVIVEYQPDMVINTAAYHNVPECEKNPERAFLVNSVGSKNLSDICHQNRIGLAYISSDYVFDGKKNSPYNEEDVPNPLNAYSISKLAGEFFTRKVKKHYVVRVASLFGKGGCRAKGGRNFVTTMLNHAKTKDRIQVTANVICSPTYTKDAAMKIKELLQEGYPSGIYHAANSGHCSWYEFALEIFSQANIKTNVERKIEGEEEGGVRKPLYSPLISEKTKPLRHWKEALESYLKEEEII